MKNTLRSACTRLPALLAVGLMAASSGTSHGANIYWNGTGTTWAGVTGWSTSATATTPNPAAVPAASDDVTFSISPVNSAQTIGLGSARSIRSAIFSSSNTASTTLLSAGGAFTLTIGAGGLTTQAGAGSVFFGSGTDVLNVTLGSGGVSTLNSSNLTTFSGLLYVNAGSVLKLNGTGGITLSNDDFIVGQAAGGSGYVFQTAGTTTANDRLIIQNTSSSYGFYSLAGGALKVTGSSGFANARFRIGNTGAATPAGAGVFYMSGGYLEVGNVTNGFALNSSDSTDTGQVPGQALLLVTGGTINSTSAINVGSKSGVAQMTVSGSALVITGSSLGIAGIVSTGTGALSNSTGIVNLNGGLLETTQVYKGSAAGNKTAYFNFNGGTLRAGADSTTFFQGLDTVTINSGGATVDSNGKSVTIGQSLLAPSGTGISSITLTGTGYTGAPYVAITGGGGTGATAVANIDGSGNMTIVITNAGVGYTSAPTITLTGGGGAVTSGTTIALSANTSGGFTKTGLGTVTLTGTNTYTGATTVKAGTLAVNADTALGDAVSTLTLDGGALALASGTATITRTTTITANGGALEAGAASTLMTFAGPIGGAGALTKSGTATTSSTVYLTGSNSYAGGTFIQSGVLQIDSDQNLGASSGSVTFNNGANAARLVTTQSMSSSRSMVLNGAATIATTGSANITTWSGVISGTGSLDKRFVGTLMLTGNNTYSGSTTVTTGALIVGVSGTGSLGNSAVSVAAGATLGGSGTIGGAVTISGTLAPGNSPGALTINNSLSMSDGSATVMELSGTSAGQFDHISLTGALTLDGTIYVTLFGGYNPNLGDSFNLYSGWTGSIVNNGVAFDFSNAVLGGGLSWDTSNFLSTGSIVVIPEPATMGLAGLGLVMLAWRARLRRASRA